MDARQCTATSKRSGERCRRLAMRGLSVCYMHGGKSPRAVHAGRVRVMEEEARRILERLEGTPITDAGELYEHLARIGGRVVALMDVLAERAAELRSWATTDAFGKEDVRAYLAAYERALDRSGRFLTALAKLDVEVRLVAIREAQAAALVVALQHALAHVDVGLDPARQQRARALFAAELVTAGVRVS